jgi:hypothetical protein
METNHAPAEDRTPAVHHAARRYTDWAIAVLSLELQDDDWLIEKDVEDIGRDLLQLPGNLPGGTG